MTLQSVIDEKVEAAKQEGMSKGLVQGRQEGMKKGMSKGLVQGRALEREDFIVAMYKKGIELSEIASIANISIDKVKKIISSKAFN